MAESSVRFELLRLLEAQAGRAGDDGRAGFVSGGRIADALGVSRTAIWKQIDALKRRGYEIESLRSRGYRLVGSPDRILEERLLVALETIRLGRRAVCLEQTGSTNSDAASLGRDGAAEGTVVIADAQSAGRGRLGRSWVSRPGVNLYMSVLLRPPVPPALAPQLSLVAGLAVAAVLEETLAEAGRSDLETRIKWPNDVLVGGRKICGILTEIEAEADRVSFVVVGIGVNLNCDTELFPPELRDMATSVLLASGSRVDRTLFTARLLAELERVYDRFLAEGFGALAGAWNERAALSGAPVTVSGAGEEVSGTCVGIDVDGALLVDEGAGAGPRRILAGDVTIVGGYR
ncbi:MAG: biotin--[acetyl-CoA-carboxylase] ligase [Candidatus Binatia bacterium]